LRNAVISCKKLSKRLHTDRVQLELLRTETEKNSGEIRILEAAIRLAISNSRENAARCLATILYGRALNLSRRSVVNDSQRFYSLYHPHNFMIISDV
jgi:hypothetical protein